MPYLDAEETKIYYEEHGNGEPIVFAHGAGGNHLSWWQQIPHFAKNYRCITYDHRSFGNSTYESGDQRTLFPHDLEALLNHLNIDRAFLVAQSMGGFSCLPFAVKHPERVIKLVMADTFGGIGEKKLLDGIREFRKNNIDPLTKKEIRRPLGSKFLEQNESGAFLYQEISALNPPRDPLLARIPEAGDGIMAEDLAKFSVPTLYIVGEEDALVPPNLIDIAHQMTPGSKLEIVPDAGHSVYFEKPEQFNSIVSGFFQQNYP